MLHNRDLPRESRLDYLDSIRGIAAMLVVAFHCWLASDRPARLDMAIGSRSAEAIFFTIVERLFWAGRAAVMLFFVLSGFVLARSLLREGSAYAAYAVKRICRIYPVFFIVIVASYGLHWMIGVRHDESAELLHRIVDPSMSLGDLGRALVMWGTDHSLDLDLVTWSLVQELRISLLLPLILWSVRAGGRGALAVYLIVSLACTLGLRVTTGNFAFGFVETNVVATCAVTGYFLVFFAGGVYLALAYSDVAQRVAAASLPLKTGLLAFCAAIFFVNDRGPQAPSTPLIDYAHGIAALGIIVLVMGTSTFQRHLMRPTLRWLGKISYSLYLVHLPILYVVNQMLGVRAAWSESILVVTLSLGVAHLSARWIEVPTTALGRKLAGAAIFK